RLAARGARAASGARIFGPCQRYASRRQNHDVLVSSEVTVRVIEDREVQSDRLSRSMRNQRRQDTSSTRLAHLFLSVLTTGVMWMAFTPPTEATPRAAWVQLIGPDGRSSVRAIIKEGECPDLTVDGKSVPMDKMPGADFRVRVCERTVRAGTASALLEGKSLPLPSFAIRRIVVLGDTGCRVKKKKTQNCNKPKKWPYA